MSGNLLFQKYRLGERIARGGMAEIYHAQVVGASGFAREIVVKRILPELVEDPEFRTMFQDEAKLAARLEHPNIVQIFDFDQVDDSFYIAMEYVRGADLAKLIRVAAEQAERLPPEVAVFVVSEVLEGLRYAHALRDEDGHPLHLIHRDISPANILLSYAGAVKLADFGIAKAATSMVHTSAGILKGKYPYMSPEQAAGKPTDRRSDLFSVGIVLYQALTGRRPFRGKDSVELLERVIQSDYVPARQAHPGLPAELDAIVVKALQADLGARYQDAAQFIGDLRSALPRQPSREDLEQCLQRLVPDRPRTSSAVHPPPHAAAEAIAASVTLHKAPQGVSVRIDADAGPEEPTTRQGAAAGARGAKARWWRPALAIGVALVLLAGAAAWLGDDLLSGRLVAHRRPQERQGPVSAPPFTVLARLSPDQELELRRNGLDAALAERGLELRSIQYVEYEDLFRRLRTAHIDLASVPLVAARALAAEDLVMPVSRLAGSDLDAMRNRFTAPAVEVATVDTALGSGMVFVPEMLEVHILAYRRSKVALAVERWAEHRDEIEGALRAVNGQGLPSGYTLEADVSDWDEFDTFVVGWTWANTDSEGTTPAPRLAVRSESYWPSVEDLLDSAARIGENRAAWARRPPLVDALTWLALHREHGLQRAEVWDSSPTARCNGTSIGRWFAAGEIYMIRANQFRVSELHADLAGGRRSFDMSDVGFAPLPRGVSVELGDDGAPLRQGRHDGLVNAWMWAVPTSAADPQRSLAVALALTTPAVQTYFAARNCWIPTVRDLDIASEASGTPEHCRSAMAPGIDRLRRPLLVAPLPDSTRLAEALDEFESLWDELLVERGYRGPDGSFDPARFQDVVARHVPEQ